MQYITPYVLSKPVTCGYIFQDVDIVTDTITSVRVHSI